MRGRVFLQTVARMRADQPGNWATSRPDYDKALARRLMSRVAYGGRKGRRAFLRLWRMGIRPRALEVRLVIKGWEMADWYIDPELGRWRPGEPPTPPQAPGDPSLTWDELKNRWGRAS